MLPFSVFRTFLLFIFGWVILGLGIYFAYDAYRGFQFSEQTPPVSIPNRLDNEINVDDQSTLEQTEQLRNAEKRSFPWSVLIAAILCLGISFGGRLPLRLFMKNTASVDDQVPAPSSRFQVVRPCGSRLRGQIFGSDQKPTLVLTHGWSLDSSAWKYLLPYLLPRYRIVVWDLPGLGTSTGPTNNDYSLEKMANDLNAVLEQELPGASVILIGHSIGGMIQQTFCRLHHEKLGKSIKGMVLLQTTYTNPLETNAFAAIVKPLEPLVAVMNYVMIPLSGLVWLSNWQSYFNGSAHWAARFESFTGKQTWQQLDHSARLGAKAWPAVLARGNFAMMKFNEEPTLASVQVPVLVVSGSNDRLTIQSASKHIEGLLPDPTGSSHEGGHLGHLEHTESVCKTISSFADIALASSLPSPVKLDVG